MLRIVVLLGLLTVFAAVPAELLSRAPNWTLDSTAGDTVTFYEDAAGHPAVLLFWTTWCPYCRALFPHLAAVQSDYAARGVRFYALNVWEDGDPVAYFREHGYDMTLLLAADLVAEDYGIEGTPGVIVTDGRQSIHYVRPRGAEPAAVEQALRTQLDALLANPP
ncbi:MAG: TlpA family protein disulfide reductase [Gammaproteobacteria bacterium]